MVEIPQLERTEADLIYELYEERARKKDWRRPHLGASLIGRPCKRELWYSFRWATEPTHVGRRGDVRRGHSGKLLRLFERGKREETWLLSDLRAVGLEVWSVDRTTGEQVRVEFLGGHFGGSLDGMVRGVVGAPVAWHAFEAKTINLKQFKELQRDGVKVAKPEHYAQMQTYMHGLQLQGIDCDRALYIAVCKDDDRIHRERVRYDRVFAEGVIEKARSIIEAPNPPPRISEDPAWWQCKFCTHHEVCHEQKVPEVSCRTCLSATAEPDGTWSCDHWRATVPLENQSAGCQDHLLIPALVPGFVQQDAGERWVSYMDGSGREVRNGDGGSSSLELRESCNQRRAPTDSSSTNPSAGDTDTHAR